MVATWAESLPARPALLAAAVVAPLLPAYALVQSGPKAAVLLAGLPLLALLAPALLTPEGRTVLLCAALALPIVGLPWVTSPLPIAGPAIYPQDLIALLALGAGLFAWLTARARGEAFVVPRTAVMGWPFVLFALAIVVATMRGHYEYGASLFGQPLRFVIYAGIVLTLTGLTPHRLYRLLVAIFYTGTMVAALVALYYIATGTSQTDQFELSTGGTRILGLSTSLYCAGALFLALLSLRLDPSPRERALHLIVAAIALFCVVAGFGRAIYAASALVCLLLFVASRSVRHSIAAALPLALPFLILFAIFLPKLAPELVEASVRRVSAPPARDANVQWRLKAGEAVYEQIREQPIIGVGFGRTSEFVIDVQSSSGFMVPVAQNGGQDPHNGFLYLWAGGGLLALGSFLLVIAVFARDAVQRYRRNPEPYGRLVLLWSSAMLGSFLLFAATSPALNNPADLLTIMALLVLPGVVQALPEAAASSPAVARKGRSGGRAHRELLVHDP